MIRKQLLKSYKICGVGSKQRVKIVKEAYSDAGFSLIINLHLNKTSGDWNFKRFFKKLASNLHLLAFIQVIFDTGNHLALLVVPRA